MAHRNKKTILISAYTCNPNGVSESLAAFNFVRILIKQFSVIVLTTKDNEAQIKSFFYEELPKNLNIIAFTDKYPGKNLSIIKDSIKLGYFIFNYKFYRYLKKNPMIVQESDILYHKSPSSFRYLSNLVRFNKPFIFGPTGGGLQTPEIVKELFVKENKILKLKKLDKFLLNTRLYKNHYYKTENILITLPYVKKILGPQYNSKYVEIFDTGIDTSKHINEKTDLKELRISFVGRLTAYKGAELLIKAVSNIKNKYPNLIVDIVGDGEEKNNLIDLCKKMELDKVIFHGHLNHTEVETIYKKSSVFCFPTLTEASGNSLIEAMSYGLPIVTINNGGPKYMCPEEGSFKIDIDAPEKMILALSKSIDTLLRDKQIRNRMGKFNRKHCVENYDWKIIEKKLINFFNEKLIEIND